jgi:DNA-binding PadR family transcriptional regulator
LDESAGLDERIKALQKEIEEMKRQQQEEQLEHRKALKDRLCDLRSPEADEQQERKKIVQEQIDEIKRLHKEQQERQKALLEQLEEIKQHEKEAQKERKKSLRLGFVLKLGKAGGEHLHHDPTRNLPTLQDQGDVEVRKGFLKLHILGVLAEGPSHGYEIMHCIGHHTGHMWRPSPGSMYPALESLESKGFISCQGDGRRKVYSLTPKGRDVLVQIRKKHDEQFLEMKAFMAALFGE